MYMSHFCTFVMYISFCKFMLLDDRTSRIDLNIDIFTISKEVS